jgi:hypothetical protein
MTQIRGLIKACGHGNVEMSNHQETIKQAVDAASVVTVVGTLMDVLPAIAALFTIVWTVIRIWETQTVRDWISNAKRK